MRGSAGAAPGAHDEQAHFHRWLGGGRVDAGQLHHPAQAVQRPWPGGQLQRPAAEADAAGLAVEQRGLGRPPAPPVGEALGHEALAGQQAFAVLLDQGPPEGLGFIIRTAGIERSQADLQRDLNYLLRLWNVIVRRVKKHPAPVDIYEESDMIIRTIRDIFTGEVDRILIDEPRAYERAREFMKIVMPKHEDCIELYQGKEPIFNLYNDDWPIATWHPLSWSPSIAHCSPSGSRRIRTKSPRGDCRISKPTLLVMFAPSPACRSAQWPWSG